MLRSTLQSRVSVLIGAVLVFSCTTGEQSDLTVYEGARVVVGDGNVIEDALFVVEDGRFTTIGPRAAVTIPSGATTIDLSGRTVIPALVNAHAHLPVTRVERTELLQHMAYYGTGLVVSLGHDSGVVPFAMQDELVPDGARSITVGRGITRPEPGRAETPYWVNTEDEARTAVRELAGQGVDFVKIWVDDRGGRYDKLTPALYGAVIDEAHANGRRVTAHVFTLEDAKGLLRAGLDAFAHGIRDRDVDDELVALWQERPAVVLVPNLPNPGVPHDVSWLTTVGADRLAELREAASADRPAVQESFGIQARNLARLNGAGVTIAFGTDGGVPWAVHLELEDMVRTGMTPAEVLMAATGTSAELMGVSDVGSIASGKSADFIVLTANPLDDITNTRRIESVFLRGMAVDREGIAARLTTGATP